MRTTIGAKVVIKDYNTQIEQYAKENLIFDNPRYFLNQRLGKSNYKIPKQIVLYEVVGNEMRLPYGVARSIYPIIKDSSITLEFNDCPMDSPIHTTTLLRPYQQVALDKLVQAKGGILVAPCGSGKTLIGINLIATLQKTTLWIVHTTDLMLQAKQVAEKEFIGINQGDIGTITDGKVDIGKKITFATIQTLSKIKLEDYKDYWGVVIVDESSHCVGSPTMLSMYMNVLSTLNAQHKYGLTATPKRVDGLTKCMFALLGEIAHTITDKDVASVKCKADLIVVPLSTMDTLDIYDTSYKVIPYRFNDYIANNEYRNRAIVQQIVNVAKENTKHIQLVLCSLVVQAQNLERILINETDLKVGVFVGSYGKKNNRFVLENYTNYDVIIATYSIASEGLDMPKLDVLHLASPRSKNNKSLLTQCIGRVERAEPSKKNAYVYTYEDINIPHSRAITKAVKLAMGVKNIIYK